jgi:hypothetical protein
VTPEIITALWEATDRYLPPELVAGFNYQGDKAMKEERNLFYGKGIPLVDDEPDVSKIVEDFRPLCNVKRPSSLNQASEMLETQNFDMAILDTMSGNGYKLLEHPNEANVMAVMLTAHGFDDGDTRIPYGQSGAGNTREDSVNGMTMDSNTTLDAQERIKHRWWHWLDRLGAYNGKAFGSQWIGYEEFWEIVLKEKYNRS